MRLAVCYQDVDPRRGGAETYVYDLCRGLIAAGHHVDLVASTWDEQTRPLGLCVRPLALTARSRMGRIWQFARRCEAFLLDHPFAYDCSIGFVNTWGQDVLIPQGGVRAASLAANSMRFRSARLATAYQVAKRMNPGWWLYQEIERRQYDPRRGSRFVAVSRMVRDHMHKYHRVEPHRVRVIPNAIDAARLALADTRQARASFRNALGLPDDARVGLFLAHNFKLKGLEPLLRALALRRETYRDPRPVHVVVCGGGSLDSFRAQVNRLGLQAIVHLVGFLDDVRAGFHGSDFFVLPSYYDPCSLVVFEALVCGLPVITTRSNGASEVIEPSVHGAVIDRPDNVEQLAAAIDLLCDDERRRMMRLRCSELGRIQTFDRHLAALLELVEEVARQKRAITVSVPGTTPMGSAHRSRSGALTQT
jgi:UDP-glucose:(heptosyl)LPS alpha-1,3-glucosyltransferase